MPLKKKLYFRLILERFGLGGIISFILTIILININWLLSRYGGHIQDVEILAFDIIGGTASLIIGGVCGLIWKNSKVIVIGGLVTGLIDSLLLILLIQTLSHFGN